MSYSISTESRKEGCKGCIFDRQDQITLDCFEIVKGLVTLGLPDCSRDRVVYIKGEKDE